MKVSLPKWPFHPFTFDGIGCQVLHETMLPECVTDGTKFQPHHAYHSRRKILFNWCWCCGYELQCTVARRRFCCVRRSMVMGASGMYKPKLDRESPHDRPRCFLGRLGLGVLSKLSSRSSSSSLAASSDSCLPLICAMLMTHLVPRSCLRCSLQQQKRSTELKEGRKEGIGRLSCCSVFYLR